MTALESKTDVFRIDNLEEDCHTQQTRITASKDFRKYVTTHKKSTSCTHERVKNIVDQLSRLKRSRSKADMRQNVGMSVSVSGGDIIENTNLQMACPLPNTKQISSCEKVQLFKQLMEQNKLKIAKRESNKRGIEEMVSQLKAQIESERSPSLGGSMGDLSPLGFTPVNNRFKSVTDLSLSTFNSDKEKIIFSENRMKFLQKQLETKQNILTAEKYTVEDVVDFEDNSKAKELTQLIIEANNSSVDHLFGKTTLDNTEENLFQIQRKILGTEQNYKLKIEQLTLKLQKLNKLNEDFQQKLENIEQNTYKTERSDNSNKVDDANKTECVKEKISILQKENRNLKLMIGQSNIVYRDASDKPIKDLITSEDQTETHKVDVQNLLFTVETLKEQLKEKIIENNVLNANFHVLQEKFKAHTSKPSSLKCDDDGMELEATTLKSHLDETHKNILKMKLLQSDVDCFKAASNVHNEHITEENRHSQHKLMEAGEAMNQLKLELVAHDLEMHKENKLQNKIKILETTCQSQTSTIELLEQQNQNMNQKLNTIGEELVPLRDFTQERKRTTQLEERINKLNDIINNQKLKIKSLREKLQFTEHQNIELMNKMEEYSAKSTQIDKTLNQQERDVEEDSFTFCSINNSNIDEESLTAENQCNKQNLNELLENRSHLEKSLKSMKTEIVNLQNKYEKILFEKECLLKNIDELTISKDQITQKFESLLTEKRKSLLDNKIYSLIVDCEQCLSRLDFELVNYKKSTDKNSKLITSKKLATEAKSVSQQINDFLEQLKADLETESAQLNVLDLVHKCQQIENITANIETEFRILKSDSKQKDLEIERLNSDINFLRELTTNFDNLMIEKDVTLYDQIEKSQVLKNELDNKNKEIDILKELIADQQEKLITSYEQHDEKFQPTEEYFPRTSGTNKLLPAEQSNVLAVKQHDIEILKKQIVDLYKTVEENDNEIIAKKVEIKELKKFNDKLTESHKEQHEKLKKFAINLKRKIIQCNELKTKIRELENMSDKSNALQQYSKLEIPFESLSQECNNLKKQHIEDHDLKTMLGKDIEEKERIFSILLCEEDVKKKEKNSKIEKLINENDILRQKEINTCGKAIEVNTNPHIQLNKLKQEYSQLFEKYENEKQSFQDTISRLQFVHRDIETKLRENKVHIEFLQEENNRYKEKLSKLATCITSIEERQHSLEFHEKFKKPQKELNQCRDVEDTLVCRLNKLFKYDHYMGQKYNDIQVENKQLMEHLNYLKENYNELLHKIYVVETEFQYFRTEKYEMLKNEHQFIKKQIEINENELHKIHPIYNFQLTNNCDETDDLKNEENIKLGNVGDKQQFLKKLKATLDKVMEHKHEILELKQNIGDLEQIKIDLEERNKLLKTQNEYLTQEQNELRHIRKQVTSEKTKTDNITHICSKYLTQNPDQILLEAENNKLKELLAEKDAVIESYHQQNFQLQMMLPSISTSETAYQFTKNAEITSNDTKCKLESELNQVDVITNEGDKNLKTLLKDLADIRVDLIKMTKKYSDLQFKYFKKQKEINIVEMNLNEMKLHDEKEIGFLDRKDFYMEMHTSDSENALKHLTFFKGGDLNRTSQQDLVKDKENNLEENTIELETGGEVNNRIEKLVSKQFVLSNIPRMCHSKLCNMQDDDSVLKKKIRESQEYIEELELERNILINEKIELQVKSARLLKKLKEYKNKIDNLTAGKCPSVESNNFDSKIQEEKLQRNMSDKEFRNMEKIIEVELLDTESLFKETSILKDDNHQPTPTRQKQDIEIDMHQTQSSTLNEDTRKFNNWSNECSGNKMLEKNIIMKTLCSAEIFENINEIQCTLKELEGDKNESHVRINQETENSYPSNFQLEITNLEKQFSKLYLAHKNLKSQLNEYQIRINELIDESDILKSQYEQLDTEYRNKINENNKLTETLDELTDKNNHLAHQIDLLRIAKQENSSGIDHEINKLEVKIHELNSNIQHEDDEIGHLKQKTEKVVDDQSNSLIGTIFEHNKEIDRSKQIHQIVHNNTSQEQEIDDVNYDRKFLKLSDRAEVLDSEKDQLEKELQSLKNHVNRNSKPENEMKQGVFKSNLISIDTKELKKSLNIFKQKRNLRLDSEYASNKYNCEENLRELETQFDEVIERWCEKVATTWQQQLLFKELQLKEVKKELALSKSLVQFIDNTTIVANNDSSFNIIHKLQSIIENQEQEILTLKEKLILHSAECATALTHNNFYSPTMASNMDFEMKFNYKLSKNTEDDNFVHKSDLDLALYRLHQRDMRCEELTLELVNLLEERDTLQLKLSNSLRQIESIRQKAVSTKSDFRSDSDASSPYNAVECIQQSKNLSDNILENDHELSAKLSELHTVCYTKDKSIQEERDQRRREMKLIEQDVSKIPSEAVSEIDKDNLSNIKESPSTVLLNWLWSKTSRSD